MIFVNIDCSDYVFMIYYHFQFAEMEEKEIESPMTEGLQYLFLQPILEMRDAVIQQLYFALFLRIFDCILKLFQMFCVGSRNV